jgi:hypothetical protein
MKIKAVRVDKDRTVNMSFAGDVYLQHNYKILIYKILKIYYFKVTWQKS